MIAIKREYTPVVLTLTEETDLADFKAILDRAVRSIQERNFYNGVEMKDKDENRLGKLIAEIQGQL